MAANVKLFAWEVISTWCQDLVTKVRYIFLREGLKSQVAESSEATIYQTTFSIINNTKYTIDEKL